MLSGAKPEFLTPADSNHFEKDLNRTLSTPHARFRAKSWLTIIVRDIVWRKKNLRQGIFKRLCTSSVACVDKDTYVVFEEKWEGNFFESAPIVKCPLLPIWFPVPLNLPLVSNEILPPNMKLISWLNQNGTHTHKVSFRSRCGHVINEYYYRILLKRKVVAHRN